MYTKKFNLTNHSKRVLQTMDIYSIDAYKNEISKKAFAYEEIKRKIINNELKPGQVLNERDLCDMLNVSRTPVREALLKLSNDGLVNIMQNRGALVSNITYEMITEIYDVRWALESLAARLFCEYALDEEIKKLGDTLENLKHSKESGDIEEFVKEDRKFHNIIIEGARNKKLISIMEGINSQVERITNLTKKDEKRSETTLIHHENLFSQIQQRNKEEAEKFMKYHIAESKDYHLGNLNHLLARL